MKLRYAILLCLGAAFLLGLGLRHHGFDFYRKIDEHYALTSNVGRQKVHLVYLLDNGDAVERIPAHVVDVAWNSAYIVAKHQTPGSQSFDFFYLVRAKDGQYQDPSKVVYGGYSDAEFAILKRKLGLPDFQ